MQQSEPRANKSMVAFHGIVHNEASQQISCNIEKLVIRTSAAPVACHRDRKMGRNLPNQRASRKRIYAGASFFTRR